MFVPNRLSYHSDTTAIEESFFVAIYYGRKQWRVLTSSRKVSDIFDRF